MTRFLLDSDTCILYINGDQQVRKNLLEREPSEVLLCAVVKAELLYGARNSASVQRNLDTLAEFFEPFDSLPFDDGAAHHYGILRAHLRRLGRLIGGNDMMIAATALSRDMVLVTRNAAEFGRVEGLRFESW